MRSPVLIPIVLVACLLGSGSSSARADTLLRLDGLTGAVTAEGRDGWIRVESYSERSMASPIDPKQTSWNLKVEKVLDRSSPELAQLSAAGRAASTGEFIVRESFGEAGQLVVVRYLMSGVRINDRRVDELGGKRREQLTLTARSVRMSYFERDATGRELLRTQSSWTLSPRTSRTRTRDARTRAMDAKARAMDEKAREGSRRRR